MIPLVRLNDVSVAVFNIILGNLALVGFHLLFQEVHSEPLLKQGIALVLLVGEDAGRCRRGLWWIYNGY